MTKESFEKLDKTKDIYCECCQQNKPTSSFNYRNIKTNIRSANRCKTCDWFYRNHKGHIPVINGFTEDEVRVTVTFMLENNDIYINTLSKMLNRTIEDTIDLIYKLNLKNIHVKVKSNCECCGKEIEDFLSVYLKTKNPYCSLECYWTDKTNKMGHGEDSQFYNRVETTCTNCGKKIKVIPSDYNKTNRFGDNHNFCSHQCYWDYRSKYYIEDKASMYNYEFSEKQKQHSREILLKNLKDSDRLETGIQLKINSILENMNVTYERERIFDYYSVDNYLPICNGIIEVMGDYWHVSPLRYNKEKYLMNEMQQKQLHRDKIKYSYIINHYQIPILYLWETDINNNPDLCIKLIDKYIQNGKNLENYHSFNWQLKNDNLSIKEDIITPYQNMSVDEYRYLIKKKVG